MNPSGVVFHLVLIVVMTALAPGGFAVARTVSLRRRAPAAAAAGD